jgi:hypothetical protein
MDTAFALTTIAFAATQFINIVQQVQPSRRAGDVL